MPEDAPNEPKTPRKSAAVVVAGGILASRLIGLLRERAFTYFFGISAHADVLQLAFKTPNFLQNLLGEGTISAAFIPIYSRMLAEGRPQEARRFAGAILGLLLALVTALVVGGILLAPYIVAIAAPGYINDAAKVAAGELSINRYALAVEAVQIIFPMAGVLVLSAWALGVLNSHRKFFVPYFAPVLWNAAIIGGLAVGAVLYLDSVFGIEAFDEIVPTTRTKLLFAGFLGALVGGVLQFLVQLPLVIREMKGFRLSFSTRVEGVREAIRAFGPVVAGRGVAQISGYLDNILASLLAVGALSSFRAAFVLYMLPISLFGMSVAASELPELSRLDASGRTAFLGRITQSLRQIQFLVVPTVLGYLLFGFLLVGLLYRTGSFTVNANWLVYFVLGGYTLGLVATTMSRLLQNGFYALNDTKTPAKLAVVRVGLSAACAVPLMFWMDTFAVAGVVGIPAQEQALYLGAVGLSLGTSVGAWAELVGLRVALRRRIDTFRLPWGAVVRMGGVALLAAAVAGGIWWLLRTAPLVVQALVVVGSYGIGYLALAHGFGISELQAWVGRLRRKG